MQGSRPKLVLSRGNRKWRGAAAVLAALALPPLAAAPAMAAIGYEQSAAKPGLPTGAELQHGVAVDQASHEIYVAVIARSAFNAGEIRRLSPDGTVTGSFGDTSGSFFSGVAVDPLTQGFYGAEATIQSPAGKVGTPRIDVFSSAGALGTAFATSDTEGAPQIATDSGGLVYFPNAVTDSVQAFNSAGTLQETIVCTGCPGGAFGQPMSVAIDSDGDLYVVDLTPDRVLKFTDTPSGYAFASVLQSGRGASGVGVDPSTDDVFVTAIGAGGSHIVAYDDAGVEFDDFGARLASPASEQVARLTGPQIAADGGSHRLYVSSRNQLVVFDRVTISPPVLSTDPASGVGQQVAKLEATVNAKGHAVLTCRFEYVDDAEFLAEGFTSPSTSACSKMPDGTSDVAVSAALSGLPPATEYHFRAVATSHAGTTTGSTRTFSTLPALPPLVATDAATGVTESAATLVGRVNPRGGSVSDCHFEYGPTASYGSSAPCSPKPGPVASEVTSKASLTGLQSDSTYHYRLVVTTNAGNEAGGDVAFTTASPPPPPPPDPAPATPAPSPSADQPSPATAPPASSCRPGFVKVKSAGRTTCVKRCRKGFVRRKVKGKPRCVRQAPRRRAGRR